MSAVSNRDKNGGRGRERIVKEKDELLVTTNAAKIRDLVGEIGDVASIDKRINGN